MGFFESIRQSIALSASPLAIALAWTLGTAAPVALGQPENNPLQYPPVVITADRLGIGAHSDMIFYSPVDRYWNSDTYLFEPNLGEQVRVPDASDKPCDQKSGNPVILTTGNKIETVTDFFLLVKCRLR